MTLNDLASRPVPPEMTTTRSGFQLPAWSDACTLDPEAVFPLNGRPSPSVLAECEACPVRQTCLEFALAGPWMPYGPWGGVPQAEVQQMWVSRHPRSRTDTTGVIAALGLIA